MVGTGRMMVSGSRSLPALSQSESSSSFHHECLISHLSFQVNYPCHGVDDFHFCKKVEFAQKNILFFAQHTMLRMTIPMAINEESENHHLKPYLEGVCVQSSHWWIVFSLVAHNLPNLQEISWRPRDWHVCVFSFFSRMSISLGGSKPLSRISTG